jgi:hypothetical protein
MNEEYLRNKLKSLTIDNSCYKVRLRLSHKLRDGKYGELYKLHRESRKETQLIQEVLRLRRELRRKEAAIEIMLRSQGC